MKPKYEICLYGTPFSSGWLARNIATGQLFGDGVCFDGRTLTLSIWEALAALRDAGAENTDCVTVFRPDGLGMFTLSASDHPWYGSIQWEQAPQYVVSLDRILDTLMQVK